MRTLLALAFLGASFSTACMSAAREEAIARGSSWPFGTYELVSFNGQSLPVELSDGRVLSGSELTLSEGFWIGAGHRDEGVGFQMILHYPRGKYVKEETREWYGAVRAEEEPAEGARVPLEFEVIGFYSGANSWVFRGFDEFPLEWGSREYASATLFGNELRVGDGEKVLVFMRR